MFFFGYQKNLDSTVFCCNTLLNTFYLHIYPGNSSLHSPGRIYLISAYGFRESDPYQKFVFDRVVKEEKFGEGEKSGKYKCDDSCAVLTVQGKGRSKGKKVKILMLKKEDGWRIDLAEQQDYWNENK